MSGNVTASEGLHVTGKDRDRTMQHRCCRHADLEGMARYINLAAEADQYEPNPVYHVCRASPEAVPRFFMRLATFQRERVLY